MLVLKTLKIENFERDLLKELHSLTHQKRQKQGKKFLLDMKNEVPMTPLIQDLSGVSNIVRIDKNWLALHTIWRLRRASMSMRPWWTA